MTRNDCPQCAILSAALNELVKTGAINPPEEIHRLKHVEEASAELIQKYISQTLDAEYGPMDGSVLFEDLKNIRDYINYGIPLVFSED